MIERWNDSPMLWISYFTPSAYFWTYLT